MNKIDGRYLRELREQNGYSLRAFAEKIYSSKSAVQRWEQTFIPESPEILNKIAEVFDMEIDEMRRQSENKYGKRNDSVTVDELSPDKLAEIKFGMKGFIILIAFMFGIAILLTLFLIL